MNILTLFDRLVDKIVHIGIDDKRTLQETRIIKFINLGGFVCSLFCVLILAISFLMNLDERVMVACSVLAVCYCLIPIVNLLKWYEVSKLAAVLFFSMAVLSWNWFVSDKVPFYLLLPLIISYIFYKKWWVRGLFLVVFFAFFLEIRYNSFIQIDWEVAVFDFFLFFSVYVFWGFTEQNVILYERRTDAALRLLQEKNEQLEAQQRLKKSEQFFRSIFENSQLGMVTIDSETNIKQVNPAFCRQVEYDESELFGMKLIEVCMEGTDGELLFEQLLRGAIKNFELRDTYLTKLNNKIDVFLHVSGLYDRAGNFVEAVVMVQNITDQVKAEKALQESEERWRFIFDHSPVGITIRDFETDQYVSVNHYALERLGYTRAEFLSKKRKELWQSEAELAKNKAEELESVGQKRKMLPLEHTFVDAKGRLIYAEMTRSFVHINGKSYILSIFRDITEQKTLEIERRNRYREQQTFFDALPISFLYVNENLKILRANKVVNQGRPEPVEGKSLQEVFSTVTPQVVNLYRYIFQTGKTFLNAIETSEMEDGRQVWFKIDRIPVKNEAGKVIGLIIFSTDVTDIKQTEAELALKNAELQHYIETNLQLESFAYIASHDLKEPLRMIHSFTQLLQKRLTNQLDPQSEEYMKFVLNGVKRMKNLLDDLLEYSTIGKREGSRQMVDLNDTIYNVVQNLQHLIQEKGGEIHTEALPTLHVYPTQMVQLFQNLLSNALKFSRSEQPPVVEIYAQEQPQYVLFEVRDNGIGIEKEYLKKIFLVFKRLHGHEFSGTGIGLATCKKIVDGMGGKIWVESEKNKGTSFFFTLPKTS